jgi:hypothetical protein
MRAAKDLEKIGRNRDIPRGENMGGGKYGGGKYGDRLVFGVKGRIIISALQ